MATGWSHSTKENSNFARLCRLLLDGGTNVLRGVFDSIHPPSSLHTVLHSPAVHSRLKWLRTKKILNKEQWDKLYPKIRSSLTSKSFDITLLFLLLRNICNLTPPASGWNKLPTSTDMTKEADLARIKWYRNEVYGHVKETAIGDTDFERYWKEISDVLVRLGGTSYKTNIEKLKVESMDIETEKFFIEAVKEWEKQEQTLKRKIDEASQSIKRIESKVDRVLDQRQRGQHRSLTDTQSVITATFVSRNADPQDPHQRVTQRNDNPSHEPDEIANGNATHEERIPLAGSNDHKERLQVTPAQADRLTGTFKGLTQSDDKEEGQDMFTEVQIPADLGKTESQKGLKTYDPYGYRGVNSKL